MLANLAMQNKKYIIYPQTIILYIVLYWFTEGGTFSHARKMCNAEKGKRNYGGMNIVKVLVT